MTARKDCNDCAREWPASVAIAELGDKMLDQAIHPSGASKLRHVQIHGMIVYRDKCSGSRSVMAGSFQIRLQKDGSSAWSPSMHQKRSQTSDPSPTSTGRLVLRVTRRRLASLSLKAHQDHIATTDLPINQAQPVGIGFLPVRGFTVHRCNQATV